MTALRLDVVIAATDSAEAVARCLASLGGPAIVAYDPERIDRTQLPSGVFSVAGEAGSDAHRLRRIGCNHSSAEIVVFTEDSCLFDPGWAAAWDAAFADPAVLAATGPVEHAPGGTVTDWAVFFCEYAPFLATYAAPSGDNRRAGPSRLAGNNFAIRRPMLSAGSEDIHEGEILSRVKAIGGRATLAPRAIAWHVRRFRLADAIRDRLRFGFHYGCRCTGAGSRVKRASRIALGPAMLVSQVGRLVATLVVKRRLGGRLLEAGPLTLLLLTAWTAAEWLGWLRGSISPRSPSLPRGGTADRSPSTGPAPAASRPRDCRPTPAHA